MLRTSGPWATMFGYSGEEETEVALIEVIDWASDHEIEIEFIEITDEVIREWEISPIVTLRYYDFLTANSRVEAQGLAEILDIVMP